MSLQTIKVSSSEIQVLDQLQFPIKFEYIVVKNTNDASSVIKSMQVRGAPLISVVAVEAIRLDVNQEKFNSKQQLKEFVMEKVEFIRKSRPTAVNLFNDTKSLMNVFDDQDKSIQDLIAQINDLVNQIHNNYEKACTLISQKGVDLILQDVPNKKLNVMTICNTGKLATPGDGTALGIVREFLRRGMLNQLYITETRPYNQGIRLTASEAVLDNIPATLITDNMAAAAIRNKSIDLIVVGADRVAKNGDTANKIGTYGLAVLANYHKIPFYVALPASTLDLNIDNGDQIVIEERPHKEITHIQEIQLAPSGINVWNPSFDVTPSYLIKRIITENGEFEVDRSIGCWRLLDHEFTTKWMKDQKFFDQIEEISFDEVGDGNLNLIFIAKGSQKVYCIKQSLPYIRCVGPEWPFPLNRSYYEFTSMSKFYSIAPEYVPQQYQYDDKLSMIVMEYLPAPFIILRKGLIQKIRYLNAAKDIGAYVAKTSFFTSGLHLSADQLRSEMAFWNQNTALCGLTEQVIFLEPYIKHDHNRWTSPQLDNIVNQIKSDSQLISCILNLRHIFIHLKQALIHGDLHTGSVMVTLESTKIIDSEFAFYGPISFDLGAFIANYIMNFFSQSDDNFKGFLLEQIELFWITFKQNFDNYWNESNTINGSDYPYELLKKSSLIKSQYIQSLWTQTLGFAGAKIIRRIIGIAHVEDFESIQNQDEKASKEEKALNFAREIVVNSQKYESLESLILKLKQS